jgi:hypothetical protein
MSSLKGNLKRVEKGYITDIENLIKDITQNYNIVTHTGKYMTCAELLKIYIPSNDDEQCYQCTAVLNNGNRCSYKSLKGTDFLYCKKHIFKYNKHKIKQSLSTCIEEKMEELNISDEPKIHEHYDSGSESESDDSEETVIDTTYMKKEFINDILYHHDDKFIYYNNKKCGYIDNNEFILIDDPFLLNQL